LVVYGWWARMVTAPWCMGGGNAMSLHRGVWVVGTLVDCTLMFEWWERMVTAPWCMGGGNAW
jgi:hypothetical protein